MTGPRGTTSKIELRVLEPHSTATVREEIGRNSVTEALGRVFQQVREALSDQGIEAGSPFARWHEWGDQVDMEAGVIVDREITPVGEVKPSSLPGGTGAIVVHAGPYEGLRSTYDAMDRWLEGSGRTADGAPWEIYLTDPSAEPDPTRWLTQVIYPLRDS
jgi:effector-binding domain-containing protein